jgi:hypothetical protein
MTTFTNVLKFNPYHDPKSGRFTSASGGSRTADKFTNPSNRMRALEVQDLTADKYANPSNRIKYPPKGGGRLSSAGMKYTPPKKGVYASTDPMTGERIENEFERTPTGQYARYERYGLEDKKAFLEYLTPNQFRNKMRLFHGEVFA